VRVENLESTASGLGHTIRTDDNAVLGIAWVHPEPKFVPLVGRSLTFGRSDDCSVRLNGEQMSRCHASAILRGQDWVLVDEGSKNGVFVDGARVNERELSLQSVVRLGDWVGVVTKLDSSMTQGDVMVRALAQGVYGGPTLASTFAALAAAADSNISVVLVGETGTGKELFARALHQLSRRTGKLVAVNCAALPRDLAESELFGYRKAAFTGADRHHVGYLREADGGTLLLDEITDLDKTIQAKLLRALEQRAVVCLGETQPRPIDLRVVAATQRSLHDAVELGLFRADLMARLSGVEVHLPPLRGRREDVVELFRVTVQGELGNQAPDLGADLAERLCLYDWPLNVREVVQVARRACVLHSGVPRLNLEHVPPRVADPAHTRSDRSSGLPAVPGVESQLPAVTNEQPVGRAARSLARRRDKDDRELDKLVALLNELRGNVNQAAKRMGISRQRAYRLMDLRPELDVQNLRQSDPGESE
jgi:DNA-binding NtrC family response regulator